MALVLCSGQALAAEGQAKLPVSAAATAHAPNYADNVPAEAKVWKTVISGPQNAGRLDELRQKWSGNKTYMFNTGDF